MGLAIFTHKVHINLTVYFVNSVNISLRVIKCKVKYPRSRGPVVGRFVHIEEVPGSNPGATTPFTRCKRYEKILQNYFLACLAGVNYSWSLYYFENSDHFNLKSSSKNLRNIDLYPSFYSDYFRGIYARVH